MLAVIRHHQWVGAKVIYSAITSLDGFVADTSGKFDWAEPDDEVHAFVNDMERGAGTYLYGRRMYEVMVAWEDIYSQAGEPPVIRDYAEIWHRAEKIVYSKTLKTVSSARTRIEPEFDPEAIRAMKASAERDISIGGPHLAAVAFNAGLVDECHFYINPVAVGGGNRAVQEGIRLTLELLDEKRFHNGVVHVHYRVKPDET